MVGAWIVQLKRKQTDKITADRQIEVLCIGVFRNCCSRVVMPSEEIITEPYFMSMKTPVLTRRLSPRIGITGTFSIRLFQLCFTAQSATIDRI